MNEAELAKWLHDNYEEVAKEQNWNTQENCKVEFDTLPDANKRTMIEIAKRVQQYATEVSRETAVQFASSIVDYKSDNINFIEDLERLFDKWNPKQ